MTAFNKIKIHELKNQFNTAIMQLVLCDWSSHNALWQSLSLSLCDVHSLYGIYGDVKQTLHY